MLVDDTEVDTFISKKMLKSAEFSNNIIEFYSAQKALEFLQENKSNEHVLPQIIFLDLHMPAMDGFDFMEKFRNLDPKITRYCKVVMLSSSLDSEDIRRIQGFSQVIKFMIKPLSVDQLNILNLEMGATIKENQSK